MIRAELSGRKKKKLQKQKQPNRRVDRFGLDCREAAHVLTAGRAGGR